MKANLRVRAGFLMVGGCARGEVWGAAPGRVRKCFFEENMRVRVQFLISIMGGMGGLGEGRKVWGAGPRES